MKKIWTHQFVILGIGVIAILGMSGQAIAAGILPLKTDGSNNLIQPLTLNTAPPITVSITDASNNDITATWLPEPGQRVNVVVKDASGNPISATISLVPPVAGNLPFAIPAAPTTSSYPGTCTNTTLATNVEPDFSLSGNQLTANDCGGMAVLNVTAGASTYKVIVPQDSNFNLIPDVWENGCSTCTPVLLAHPLLCAANLDCESGGGSPGDGYSNFDEYRGFMVSGVHIRTDPSQKDLFVHLVNPGSGSASGECGTDSYLGGGTKSYVTGNAVFANLNTLISSPTGPQIHIIGFVAGTKNSTTTEWVDRFNSYSPSAKSGSGSVIWNAPGGGTTQTEPADDRQMDINAVYPVNKDFSNNRLPQKGLRIIECLDTTNSNLLGSASLGSPDAGDNSIIYTKRIINYFEGTLGATPSSTNLTYSTYVVSGTGTSQTVAQTTPVSITHDALIAKAFEYYLGMETGHAVSLTPTVEGTKSTSYGYHHAPGTGSNLDQAIKTKSSQSTGNTFYIPTVYLNVDTSSFLLH